MGGGEHSVGTETKTDKPETMAQTKHKLIFFTLGVSFSNGPGKKRFRAQMIPQKQGIPRLT